MKNKSTLFLLLLMLFFLYEQAEVQAGKEKPRSDEVSQALKAFKNYRFGRVNVWEVVNKEELKEFWKSKSTVTTTDKSQDLECEKEYNLWPTEVKSIIQNGVRDGKTVDEVRDDLTNEGYKKYTNKTLDCAYNILLGKQREPDQKELRVIVVSTCPESLGAVPKNIIGVIFVDVNFNELSADLEDILANVSEDQIFSYYALQDEKIDETKYGQGTLYNLINSYFVQKNLKDKTLEARGLYGAKYFTNQTGSGTSVLSSDNITASDIQKFMQISQGQPESYYKSHEVIASYDLIRWTKYQEPIYKVESVNKLDSLGNVIQVIETKTLDLNSPTNKNLPLYGFELRYGIDEINFPSLWSERVTLSALWQSVKLGYVLPTNGWASLSYDLFKNDRKLTYSKGGGIAGSINIPFPLIKQSGIFDASFSHLLGDAQDAKYKDRNLSPENFNPVSSDYLIRSTGQAHYTLALNIDRDYWIRLGIGGTFYNVESWGFTLDSSGDATTAVYKKEKNEFIGGVSGRIDFMVANISTPLGARIQYFDNAISANLWLQVPIIEHELSLRFDLSGYGIAFRKKQNAWENDNVIIPSLRLIYIY